MESTISVLVENKFGVLSKIAGLFSSRGYNIKSLTVGETEDPTVSRMTIVTEGEENIIEQVKKQLNKLIDTIKIIDMTNKEYIERELAFVRVNVKGKSRTELLDIASIFSAKAVDVGVKSVCLEVTGKTQKIDAFIELLKPFGIVEIVRTGKVAMMREPLK
jgi:acetolactate synthase-1/3 small subunit